MLILKNQNKIMPGKHDTKPVSHNSFCISVCWDQKNVCINGLSILSQLVLGEMCGLGPRKLSLITDCLYKQVSIKLGSTVKYLAQ